MHYAQIVCNFHKPDKIHYMIRIPVNKLKDGTVVVTLPFESVAPIVTLETNRQDKFTSISIHRLGPMTIKESAILLQVLDYLFYNTTNNLHITNEIIIDEHALQKDVIQRNSNEDDDELLVVVYVRHDGTDRERLVCWETILIRDKVAIRLLLYDSAYAEYKAEEFIGYKELFNVELKFNKSLSKIESFELAQFVAFVTYKICNGDYTVGRCVWIYGGGRHIFDEELIKTFVKGCKKSDGYIESLKYEDISELEEFSWDDWSGPEYDICD